MWSPPSLTAPHFPSQAPNHLHTLVNTHVTMTFELGSKPVQLISHPTVRYLRLTFFGGYKSKPVCNKTAHNEIKKVTTSISFLKHWACSSGCQGNSIPPALISILCIYTPATSHTCNNRNRVYPNHHNLCKGK